MARTRGKGTDEKAMLSLALRDAVWEDLYRTESCAEQHDIFDSRLRTLIETHLPMKIVKRHSNDKPWLTDEFRLLTEKRNQAFRINSLAYLYLRNKANRLRIRLRKD